MIKKRKSRIGLLYYAFRMYVRFLHDRVFYKKVYRIDKENIPPKGTPLIVVSNHQNCLCDPLGILLTIMDRKPNVLMRADLFSINPLITKILYGLGTRPAYRLSYDGKELLHKNKDIFKEVEEGLLNGDALLLYPEGKHQSKHWLGDFSLAYLKLAFEAAAQSGYQTDVFILPCCHHYSSYYGMQEDFMTKFGTPISLKPYYELYQLKPRTAQREANEVVRKQMLDMMLHITDHKNYEAIDFLRQTYGFQFAEIQGLKADFLPEKLQSDRLLFEKLQAAKAAEESAMQEISAVQEIYDEALKLKAALKKLKVRNDNFDHTPAWVSIVLSVVALVGLLPVWLFSLWPHLLIYQIPTLVMRRVKDKRFYSTFLFAVSALVTMPIFYTLTLILVWLFVNVWVALIYTLSLPWIGLFAFYYWRFAVRTIQNIRFRRVAGTAAGYAARNLRDKLYERLNILLNK